MHSCAVLGCKSNNRNTRGAGIKFHRFPKDEKILKQWVKACCRPNVINVSTARMCSVHFAESSLHYKSLRQKYLQYSPQRFRNLEPDAVPTKYLPMQEACEALSKKAGCNLTQKLLKKKTVATRTTSTMKNSGKVWDSEVKTKALDCHPNQAKAAPLPVILVIQENKVSVEKTENDQWSNQKQLLSESRTVFPVRNLDADNQSSKKLSVLLPNSVLMPSQLNEMKLKLKRKLNEPEIRTKPQQIKTNDLNLATYHNRGPVDPVAVPPADNREPIVRITVNKAYNNDPSASRPAAFVTLYLPGDKDAKTYSAKQLEKETSSTNPCSRDTSQVSKTKINPSSSTAYSHPVVKNQYLYSKARQKERKKREQMKAHKTQAPLSRTRTIQDDENPPTEDFDESEDEYKTVLREVRELKERMHNAKRPEDDYEKIIREVRELKDKMRNAKKNPEEEYEKIIREVRELKGKTRKAKKNPEEEYETIVREVRELREKTPNANNNSVGLDVVATKDIVENVHNEEIEIMEEVSDSGEIIGEINEDEMIVEIEEHSIKVDVVKDAHSLNLNEEFLELGLLDE